jgi:NAD(P)-dependent dehydrogenase (short-subunit alcohol dehydrogenase family)
VATARQRVALVTGSSRGLGGAIVQRLARDGLAVAVNDRRGDSRALEIVRAIRDDGGVADAFPAGDRDRRGPHRGERSLGRRHRVVPGPAGVGDHGRRRPLMPSPQPMKILIVLNDPPHAAEESPVPGADRSTLEELADGTL